MSARTLVVTVDTEVNKSRDWSTPVPLNFSSVTSGIPELLQPMFARYGVRPTYLLSPEVIENEECAGVLRSLSTSAELGTHLHAEFIEPGRSIWPTFSQLKGPAPSQVDLPPGIEKAKLANLTELFTDRFGYAPTSFRSGGFAMTPDTLAALADLGYKVDSSVSPGAHWVSASGAVLDHRGWETGPRILPVGERAIVELPLSVWPARFPGLARMLAPRGKGWRRLPRLLLRQATMVRYLRPSWHSGPELVRFVGDEPDEILVAMLHSQEVVPGASPYAQSGKEVEAILRSLDYLLGYCTSEGFQTLSLSQVADEVLARR